MLEIIVFLLFFSLILSNIVMLDFNFNDGKMFFVENERDLRTALILCVLPIVNIFVLIRLIKKHIEEK